MNEENQRIFIAEACGWNSIREQDYDHGYSGDDVRQMWVGLNPDSDEFEQLPDYLKDINAMHEVVSSRVEAEGFPFQEKYTHELRAVVTRRRRGCNKIQIDFWMAEATAAQRAEAFLRAIGKWVE